MTTDSIRERTLEITKAYLSLSDEIEGLSLQDFLLIRESAVKELNGIIREMGADEQSEKQPIKIKSVPKPKEEPLKEKPSEKSRKVQIIPQRAVAAPIAPVEEVPQELEEEEEDSPRPLSKFEMLRAFPDEWN